MLTLDGIPFYIGKTIVPKGRASKHRIKYPGCLLEIIDEVPTKEWNFWEKFWIAQFKQWGFILKNIQEGGDGNTGGYKMQPLSQEIKDKISNTLKGRKQSDSTLELKRQNGYKRKGMKLKGAKSKYFGVAFVKHYICAWINIGNSKKLHLGYFKTELEAASAYNVKAIELYGKDYPRLNNI